MKDQLLKLAKVINDKYGEKEEKMAQATLTDGTIVEWDTDTLEAGVDLFFITEGERMPAPDGEHVTEDGTTITTEAGKVTNVKAPEAEGGNPVEGEELKKLKEELEATKKELKDQKAKLEEQKKALEEQKENHEKQEKEVKEVKELMEKTFELVDKLAQTPSGDPVKTEKHKIRSIKEARQEFNIAWKEAKKN